MYRIKIINRNSTPLKIALFSTFLLVSSLGFTAKVQKTEMNKGKSEMGQEWKPSKADAAFERELKDLFKPPLNGSAIQALRTIDKDRKSGKKIDFTFTTEVKGNQLTQTIKLKAPDASYVETTINNKGKKSFVISSQPGNASRTTNYDNIDATFKRASISSVRESIREHINSSKISGTTKARELEIVSKWNPKDDFKGIAETMYKCGAQKNIQFHGTLHNNVLEGKITYHGGAGGHQVLSKTIKEHIPSQMLSKAEAQELPHLLCHMVFFNMEKEFQESDINKTVKKHIQSLTTDLKSKFK